MSQVIRPASAGRHRFLPALLGALLLVVGLAGPASAAITMRGEVLRTASITIGPASTGGGRVRCPKGYRVTAGGAFFPIGTGTSTFLAASLPVAGGRAWFASGRNAESGLPTQLAIVAWCLPAARVGPVTVLQSTAALDPFGASGAYVSCPAGQRIVTGGAIWQIPGDPPAPSVAASNQLSGTSPTLQGDGWWGSGRQLTPNSARLRVVAMCRPKAAVGKLTLVAQNITNANAMDGLYLSCPAGQRALSVGAYPHKTGQGPDLEEARLTSLRSMTPITDGRGAYVAAYSINAELAVVVQCRPRR